MQFKLYSEFTCREGLPKLESDVNDFIKDKPEATVEWLQSSSSGYTRLTAIITVPTPSQ